MISLLPGNRANDVGVAYGFVELRSVRVFLSWCALAIAGVLLSDRATVAQAADQVEEKTSSSIAPQGGCNIIVSRVNQTFLQSGGSCVLASYAVSANYFTRRPIATYFEGYCEHFGLSYTNALEAEQKYADHFDAEWRKRNCRGYEVILDLHQHSKVKCFAEAREIFEGRFYLDSSMHLNELETLLKQKEAFLNITYEPGRDYHSINVIYNGTNFLSRDTNQKGLRVLPGLAKIGKLRDSVLYVKK
jgi:hypothetical protein